MIRFIIAATFLGVFLLLSYPLFLLGWILEKINKKAKDYIAFRIVQWGFGVILAISGVKITVKGKENILEQPALYVGNHRSYLDALLLHVQAKGLTGFVAKDSMEKYPSLRVWMRYIYCIFLNRNDTREGLKAILKAIEYVKQGVSIIIFPEGTRNQGDEFELLPFKEGSMKIALKSGCPIVPVAINNAADMFEKQFPRLKKTHVIIEYGTPIYPKDLSREEQKVLGATCRDIITETLKKNAKLS